MFRAPTSVGVFQSTKEQTEVGTLNSHHAYRIDLQGNGPQIAPIFFECFHRGVDHRAHLFSAPRFYEQLHAMLSAQSRKRRRRRAENATSVISVRLKQSVS